MKKSSIKNKICNYAPTVLTFISAVGVIGTTALAVKATPKAVQLLDDAENEKEEKLTKFEVVKTAGPVYIPAVAMGAATIICIFGSNALNKKNRIMLASAYGLLQQSYNEYRGKLKEMYGDEAHNAIVNAIAVEKSEETHITAQGLCSVSTLDFDDNANPEMIKTFYDDFSGRCFESTVAKVIEAEYHLNRNFTLGGCVTLNDFYNFLGIEESPTGDALGWSGYAGEYYWLDFNHRKTILNDGMEFYIIEMMFEPEPLNV